MLRTHVFNRCLDNVHIALFQVEGCGRKACGDKKGKRATEGEIRKSLLCFMRYRKESRDTHQLNSQPNCDTEARINAIPATKTIVAPDGKLNA